MKRHELDELRIDRSSELRPSGRRWLIWMIPLLALVAVAAAWFLIRPRTLLVRTAEVREAVGEDEGGSTVLNASGYVTARRQATVSSKVTGKVEEVLVEEGMRVTDGQLLARLDASLPRAALELAEAQLAAAESALEETRVRLAEARLRLDRTLHLAMKEFASQSDLDAARAEVDSLGARLERQDKETMVARRQVDLRRLELEDTVIRAPFAGIAVSKDAQPGEMISPVSAGGGFTRTGICTLVDMGSLEIEVDVNESYINRVEPEQRVEARLDAYPDWVIAARVITIVPTADREKATVRVRIAFEELDPRILPDMGVKVAFREEAAAGSEQPRRLLVPSPAVRREGSREVAWVVREARAERRAIRTGATRGDDIEVVSGLSPGERVIVQAPETVTDGDRVQEID